MRKLFDKPKQRQCSIPPNMKTRLSVLPVLLLLAAPAPVHAQYEYTVNNGAITITNYVGTAGNLTIPSQLYVSGTGEVPVTSIGSNAFNYNFTLTNVTIPACVTTIGSGAFLYCCYLTNVTLTNGLTSIGNAAFALCYSLSNITIPASVTSIGDAAFSQSHLINLTIPGTVTNLGVQVINDCYGLTNLVIANGFTSIGEAAFDGSAGLVSVTIAGSVTNLGMGAFADNDNLRSVYFAGNCPIVDQTAFEVSSSVTIYYLPGKSGWENFSSYNTTLTPVLWNPSMHASAVQNKHFGFNITGTAGIPIEVESCANLANPHWTPLQTLTLTNGSVPFSDPSQTITSGCCYRISSP